MFKLFCPSCYKSTSYDSSQPSFCSHCGTSFKDTFKSTTASQTQPTNAPTPPPQRQRPQVIIETEDESVTVPNLNKIEVVIDPNLRPNRQRFDSMSFVNEKPKPLANSQKKSKATKKPSKQETEKLWMESFPKSGKNNPGEVGE